MTWQLRRAHADDLAAIMALETSTFDSDAWSATMMLRDLNDSACYYLVAFSPEQPDTVVAYAGLLALKGATEGDIQTIAVAPAARAHGLGRTLMQALMNEARKRGAGQIFLEVRADNPTAQRLYERLGYVEVGVRRGYYQPDNVDARVMRLTIATPHSALTQPDQEVHP